MRIRIELQGRTPLLMHNPQMVDPDHEITRAIKPLTSKRKKTDKDLEEIARLEWYGGLYEEDGVVVQPVSKVFKALQEAAKVNKLGKAVGRALVLAGSTASGLNVPLSYDGPKEIDKLYANKRYHSRLSVGVAGKRVMRVRPKFLPWALVVEGEMMEDAGLRYDELLNMAQIAGMAGIGDARAIGYGKFEAKVSQI